MLEGTTFGKTIDLLQRSMDVSSLRQQVIGNNIANADVPNFKRSEINFESSLKRALESEQSRPVLELATSDPGHIAQRSRAHRIVQADRLARHFAQAGARLPVDIEEQRQQRRSGAGIHGFDNEPAALYADVAGDRVRVQPGQTGPEIRGRSWECSRAST